MLKTGAISEDQVIPTGFETKNCQTNKEETPIVSISLRSLYTLLYTMPYRAKKDIKQKKGYKIRLDLTKTHNLMLSGGNKLASHNQNANF